ncbi:MAG: type II toxin-antitoxin system YafQ family toxin [Pyramidobacter sp.]|nr:type II toxin-antitoxin system YafQ family toxin [Pyramidobacter sp.]MBQ8129409.1 type II toxin-antitoxin system YafQ family toxin [Clostridia bacterium]
MRSVEQTSAFKKDFKRESKGRYRLVLKEEFKEIVCDIASDKPLAERYCDHALTENFKGFRVCHIRPNLLLMYMKIDNEVRIVRLVRLGDHDKVLNIE